MEDFRRLELVREGSKHTIRHRWRQDKGHLDEWRAFMESLRQGHGAPIPFEELVCSTLATVRLQESVSRGKPQAVDAAAFIDAALQTPNSDE